MTKKAKMLEKWGARDLFFCVLGAFRDRCEEGGVSGLKVEVDDL